MLKQFDICDTTLIQKIKRQEIVFGGNCQLKIYGTLQCKSGKRMKKENRVFFNTLEQAKEHGYSPCGHCLRKFYKKWKDGLI